MADKSTIRCSCLTSSDRTSSISVLDIKTGKITGEVTMEEKSSSDESFTTNEGVQAKEQTSLNVIQPDLIIFYCADAYEWSEYLLNCFKNSSAQEKHVVRQQIEDLSFPISPIQKKSFSSARSVLTILSPDFLDFIDAHAEIFQLSQLLLPSRTVAMLCGVLDKDISLFHKTALVSYDAWRVITAQADKYSVLTVMQTVSDIINRPESEPKTTTPRFKLSPRKLYKENGKLFILLDKAVTEKQRIQVIVDNNANKPIATKWRNPFTLSCVIPDYYLRVARIMTITLICDEVLIGSKPIKCGTKMSELQALLTSVNSPFEFLRQTMGLATLREVDSELTKTFKANYPNSGFMLLDDCSLREIDKKKSDCELPTLLHFACHYGLRELASQLLQCPRALSATNMRNCHGLKPIQMANDTGYPEISTMIEEFKRLAEEELTKRQNGHLSPLLNRCPAETAKVTPVQHLYDVPLLVMRHPLNIS